MPTIPVPSRVYAAGERFTSSSVTVPQTVIEASVALNITDAQLKDSATDIEAIIEWAPAGTADDSPDWSQLASGRVIGNPSNRSGTPYVAITPDAMENLHGNLVRGAIVNRSATAITFPATVTFS